MKKLLNLVMAAVLFVTAFLGFASVTEVQAAEEVETLRVVFVPSREPEEIIAATEPLKQMLIDELAKEGFDVKNVEITVGTNYEAAGEALASGTADIGLIPGGTYVLYSDDVDVLLTATRKGLTKDSENAKDWNDGKSTEQSEDQVSYYKGLVIAGPSKKGQELAEKVNKGEDLTWEDLDGANWSVMSSSSSAGYIYPSIWLKEQFGKPLSELSNLVQAESYGSSMARLASEQVDIVVGYADLRRDNAEDWEGDMGRKASIWEETNVIGVTPNIYNDTVSASKTSKTMTDELKEAIKKAFINIAQTDEGKKVIEIYSHEGYKEAKDEDYDTEREAQKILKETEGSN